MKKIIFVLFFLCAGRIAHAQNEFYISWPGDSIISLEGESHIVDNAGNLYILGIINYDYGNTIIKIDRNNNMLWEKPYFNYYPAALILFLGNNMFVPYNLDIGITFCFVEEPGNDSIYWNDSRLNAGSVINNITGDTIKTGIFYDGKSCGTDGIWYSYADKNKNIYNIYTNDSFSIMAGNFAPSPAFYTEKLDSNFNIVTDTFLSPLNQLLYKDTNSISKIMYDTLSNNFVVADMYGLNIYDTTWKLLNNINFSSYNDSFRYIGIVGMAYNAGYYAINFSKTFSITTDSDVTVSYLLVLTKDGQLISSRQSLYYSDYSLISDDILLTKDNNILGIGSVYEGNYTQTPLTLVEMDLFQNVKRKVSLGRNGVIPNKISLTNDNEVIITGTAYDTVNFYSQHDMLYYYRQSLNEIPLLITDSSLCNTISVYPNPAKNSINISSIDFNATYNATTELYNILGQKLTSAAFDTKTLSIDLTNYPAGIYFLKTRSSNASCVAKIEKQ